MPYEDQTFPETSPPNGMGEQNRGLPSLSRPQAISTTATHGNRRVYGVSWKGARCPLQATGTQVTLTWINHQSGKRRTAKLQATS